VEGRDGTHEAARAAAGGDARILVFGEPRRGGKGRAVREAVARARGEVIGYADADGKVPFEEMDRLLPWLDQGYDVVIGSRARRRAHRAPTRAPPGLRAFATAAPLVRLPGIADTQCDSSSRGGGAELRAAAWTLHVRVEILRLALRGDLA
jgi:dolichyl-phosphate beta-glucosyltransferase